MSDKEYLLRKKRAAEKFAEEQHAARMSDDNDDDDELNEILETTSETLKKKYMVDDDDTSSEDEEEAEGDDGDEKISERGRGRSKNGSYVQWSTPENKTFIPTHNTKPVLKPGFYEIKTSHSIGIYFEKIDIVTEGLLRFPDSQSETVIKEINKFWNKEEIFRKYELAYKRGILLWGPPGSGKSCTIQIICKGLIRRKGIILKWTHPNNISTGIRIIREIQPDVPIIVLMEDLDSILESFDESAVLNILDGVDKVEKAVFLATTNYPEKLGPRIVNRPSRFDKRFKIGAPSEDSRKMYFEHLVSKNAGMKININQWVKDTEDLSIAHLKELFVAVTILDDPYDKAIKTLKSMKERKGFDSEDDYKTGGSVGFGGSSSSSRS